MSPQAALALQYLIVAIAVAVSAWVVFRKQAPNAARRLRIALALPLVREGRPAWLRGLGRWIAPAAQDAAGACAGCTGCEPAKRG
jgi:hypothetical protein